MVIIFLLRDVETKGRNSQLKLRDVITDVWTYLCQTRIRNLFNDVSPHLQGGGGRDAYLCGCMTLSVDHDITIMSVLDL